MGRRPGRKRNGLIGWLCANVRTSLWGGGEDWGGDHKESFFGSYNISNERNCGLDSSLSGMAQANM